MKGFSTFVSLPPLPEGKGTSAVPDLRVDPDEQNISVSSTVSPDDEEGVDSDDATLETHRKRLCHAGSKLPEKSKQSAGADDNGSSSHPVRADDETAPARDSAVPPLKRARVSSDFFDPDVLLTELSSLVYSFFLLFLFLQPWGVSVFGVNRVSFPAFLLVRNLLNRTRASQKRSARAHALA